MSEIVELWHAVSSTNNVKPELEQAEILWIKVVKSSTIRFSAKCKEIF